MQILNIFLRALAISSLGNIKELLGPSNVIGNPSMTTTTITPILPITLGQTVRYLERNKTATFLHPAQGTEWIESYLNNEQANFVSTHDKAHEAVYAKIRNIVNLLNKNQYNTALKTFKSLERNLAEDSALAKEIQTPEYFYAYAKAHLGTGKRPDMQGQQSFKKAEKLFKAAIEKIDNNLNDKIASSEANYFNSLKSRCIDEIQQTKNAMKINRLPPEQQFLYQI